ncbi:MAG TPA: hypothetical protein VFQ91_08395 [Bryobacteraceae bacterium]|nr:hypothetical protein [Bryobacteraceae bacterium]
MTRRNHTAGPVRVLLREIWLVWLLLAALHIATAQPFATGPKLHPPAPGQNVDARLVLEDAAKFVWVSGPDGTFRYDGVRYVPAAVWGLPMGEASQMDVAGGAVWVLLERDLWWFDGARFRQFPGAYDGIVGAGDLLYVDLTIGRRISVLARKDTGWELLSNSTVHPRHHQMQAGEDGRIWYGAFSALSWTKWTGTGWEYGSLPTTRKIDELWQAAPVGNNDFLTTNGHVIIRFRRDASGGLSVAGSTASESRHPREHVFPSRYGTWVLVKGMMMQLLPDGRGVNYFRYAGPYKVFSLRAGRTVLWAAAGPAGLMAFSRSQSIEWIQPETGALGAAKAVARSGSRLFFGRADVTYEVLPDSSTWDPGLAPPIPIATARPFGLPASLGPYEDTAVGPDGSLWHIQPKEGAVRVSAGGAWLGTAGGPPGPPGKAQMRKLAFSDDGRAWVASRQNLWEVLVRPTPDYLYRPGGSWQGQRHIADFFRDAGGRLYAAADNGLLRYESGVWREQPLPRCLLSTQLRTAAVATEESLWFAYRDRPGFTRAYRLSPGAPWQCNHFTGQNGFPGPTGFLRIDRQHRLWRGAGQTIQLRPSAPKARP